jgi:hypothetical protein
VLVAPGTNGRVGALVVVGADVVDVVGVTVVEGA